MKIAGLQHVTLIDFPGYIACTIFTQGCNFRCPYCHNPELLSNESTSEYIDEDYFWNFLENRKGKLDGVCITGGEPTLQNDLVEFINNIVKLGFKVKLDSNGTNPTMLKQLLNRNLLSYIAMDIKAPASKYDEVSQSKGLYEKIKESIELISNSSITYEFRTTIPKELLSIEDLKQIAVELKGSKKWVLQNYQPFKTKGYKTQKFSSCSENDLTAIAKFASNYISEVQIR